MIYVMTLPWSGAMFVQAFPKKYTETFMEGRRRAFDEFGGAPTGRATLSGYWGSHGGGSS